jgi:hypothetical protein
VVDRAGDDLLGTVVTAHRVDRDTDPHGADPGGVAMSRLGFGLGHRVSARRRRRQA